MIFAYRPAGMGKETTRSNIPSKSMSIGGGASSSSSEEELPSSSLSLVSYSSSEEDELPSCGGRSARNSGFRTSFLSATQCGFSEPWKLKPKRAASYAGSSSRDERKYK